MAAHSGGVEWTSIVKPILSASFGCFSKSDLIDLAKAIIKSESEILEHDTAFETFYLSFAALAADYISSKCTLVPKNQMPVVAQACTVLITYILQQLRPCATRGDAALALKQMLSPLASLCEGSSSLTSSELVVLTAVMKNAELPEHIKFNTSTEYEKDTSKQDGTKRSRSDLASSIIEQLGMPLSSITKSESTTSINLQNAPLSQNSAETSDKDKTDENDTQNELKMLFSQANINTMQALGAGDVLLALCLTVPSVARYRLKYSEAISTNKCLSMPATHSDAVALRASLSAISSDINLVNIAIALPILEPFTPTKISQLSLVTLSCLYCAVSTAIACSIVNMSNTLPKMQPTVGPVTPTKEDEMDMMAVNVVEKALELYKNIGNVLKYSTKGGGHIYQNHLLLGAWVIIGGLQSALGGSTGTVVKEDKGKSPSKNRDLPRVNLVKVQQGFGILTVALAKQSLPLLAGLLQDLQIESGLTGGSMENTPAPADLDILGNYSALQRVMKVLQSAPILQLYTYIATVSYRKACALKRASKHPLMGDALSQSDSTTYYQDLSFSEDSDTEEDDSESYLGLWFKETLAPETIEPEPQETPVEPVTAANNKTNTFVPDKEEPHEYLELSTAVFKFLDTYMSLGVISTSCLGGYLARYIQSGLTEQQMCLLAAILRDLDRDSARNMGILIGYCAIWHTSCMTFSQAVGRYIHNMIASGSLNDTLQAAMLAHLGVSPWVQDNNTWPMQVYSHTLAVLAQIILLKPQQEKESACISVWTRMINTLVDSICNPTANVEEGDDINVEHAQLLLFLFHSLNLMQKKSLLLQTAGGVIRCSEVCTGLSNNTLSEQKTLKDNQILLLSRFLLLLEYLMKHLYDAPKQLLEQVQFNLFQTNHKTSKKSSNLRFSPCDEIEENFRKLGGIDDNGVKPRFYVLSNVEYSNQDTPKLDGLACSFILGSPDKLRYSDLIDSLIRILNILSICFEKIGYQTLSAVQYCFFLCWRLLVILPPSTEHINAQCSATLPLGATALHSLLWIPRAANTKAFSRWLTDSLVKQGMYTQNAEALLRSVTEKVHNPRFDIDMTIHCIKQFNIDFKCVETPRLFDIVLLDALLSKLLLTFREMANTETKNNQTEKISDLSSPETTKATQNLMMEFMPYLLELIQSCISSINVIISGDVSETEHFKTAVMPHLLPLSAQKHTITTDLSSGLWALLPAQLKAVITKPRNSDISELSPTLFESDIIPSESFVLSVINGHVNNLSGQSAYSVTSSLKKLFKTAVELFSDHVNCIIENPLKSPATDIFVALMLDARTEYVYNHTKNIVDKLIGDETAEFHQLKVYIQVLNHSYKLITEYPLFNTTIEPMVLDEKVLHCIFKFWEKMLDKQIGQYALYQFFWISGEGSLVQVLLSIGTFSTSQGYSTKVLHFFNKLFQASEKTEKDFSLEQLCSSIDDLATVDEDKLQGWLSQILLGTPELQRSASVSSSNVPTPTNPATNNTPPSIEKESTPKPENISTSEAGGPDQQNNTSTGSSTDAANAEVTTTADNLWAVISDRSPSHDESQTRHRTADEKSLLQENGQLLQTLTNYIVSGNKIVPAVSQTILQSLIPLGSQILCPTQDCLAFPDLMTIMTTLADSNFGKGHVQLFTAVNEWLEICHQYLTQKEVIEKLESGIPGKHVSVLESATCLLRYLSDLLHGLGSTNARAASPPWDVDVPPEPDEWLEEIQEDDESAADDSDEDSLCNKLCTFTTTQKEFMNQHWYHCHTCKMLDGVGVCTVCARVCHRGHDISYAKYGNFFCDCGAKDDGSCQALTKRGGQSADSSQCPTGVTSSSDLLPPTSIRRRLSSPLGPQKMFEAEKHPVLAKQIESSREFLKPPPHWKQVTELLLNMTEALLPALNLSCARNSIVGCHKRAQSALAQLHLPNKKFIPCEKLMVPTLGSQEGAFENVRMSFSGEQGATIRQLLSAHMIRRVAMCCLSSPHGKRQHLAVSHEKGKITVLQLSALLKQADSSKRKLTLTRLSSAPIPFTVLSLTSNPCNEDFLAVCGLKECHVLTFNTSGSVSEHLVLHPQLETGNFIIRAIWLPGSQTILALITADFVKIYDLGKDALSPQYYFLVPTGKIRDCTFVYQGGIFYMLLMASVGYIYTQPMVEESHAKHGPFYVTNTLDLSHPDITDVKGQIGGGGVSIFYSHTLQMLFFSYSQGKNFMAPMYNVDSGLCSVIPITLSTNTSKTSSKSASTTPQPLCQWTEVPSHPGLICATLQSSNNPVVFMLNPDTVLVQEVKVLPAKAKIMDMVAIRHSAPSVDNKTTLILLCEDGSLRIYAASNKHTGYWLSPTVQPPFSVMKTAKRLQKKVGSKNGASNNKTTGAQQFPIDFFEFCMAMSDVEFGGNDLLQIYNPVQLKHRLNSTGMYIASTKATGFILEVSNPDNNMVMCGIRVQMGNQDVVRTPAYVEILGRCIQTTCIRTRWFDIPLTREESLQSDKKLSILFGPSQDPDGVIMVDNVKIYGKTKDTFGWPEEPEDPGTSSTVASSNNQNTQNSSESDSNSTGIIITPLDKMVSGLLEVIEGSLLMSQVQPNDPLRSLAFGATSRLLTMPTTIPIQMNTQAVMAALHGNKSSYNAYKDQVLINHVSEQLTIMSNTQDSKDIDPEGFYRILLIIRSMAVVRPANLTKFASALDENKHLMDLLMSVLWSLHSVSPVNRFICSAVVPGLPHTESVVYCIVDIIHAFTLHDPSLISLGCRLYMTLLLCSDRSVSFTSKHAIITSLRPRPRAQASNQNLSSANSDVIALTSGASSSVNTTISSGGRSRRANPPSSAASGQTSSGANTARSTRTHASSSMPSQQQGPRQPDADLSDPIGLDTAPSHPSLASLEAFLAAPGSFPPLMDLPPDADDEAMVELAIALSLQDHEGDLHALQQGLANLQSLAGQIPNLQQVLSAANIVGGQGGHYSDTTASAGGSDDEGSTAATDGSTLRTSLAEQAGSNGSESGGSGAESTGGVSGRSSAYGDNTGAPSANSPPRQSEPIPVTSSSNLPAQQQSSTCSLEPESSDIELLVDPAQDQLALEMPQSAEHQMQLENEAIDRELILKMHQLRVQILSNMVDNLAELKTVNGVQSIPYMQVILMLTTDLSANSEGDRQVLHKLLSALVQILGFAPRFTEDSIIADKELTQRKMADLDDVHVRTNIREVNLIIVRFLSVLMSRVKQQSSKSSGHEGLLFVSRMTANLLHKSGVVEYCHNLLTKLLVFWSAPAALEEAASASGVSGTLLKEHPPHSLPDMQPFFLRQYVKGHCNDVFEEYPQLLTEMAVRLPYQIQKHTEGGQSIGKLWKETLCEYMMNPNTSFAKRQVRKMLLFLCGHKGKYRQLRDVHSLHTHFKAIRSCCDDTTSMPYDYLVDLVEHLKACLEVASVRTGNWQKYCIANDSILPFLMEASCLLDEGVSSIILQLLQSAICNTSKQQTPDANKTSPASNAVVAAPGSAPTPVPAPAARTSVKDRKEREKSEESDSAESKFEDSQCAVLVNQITTQVSTETLRRFVKTFLLETNSTNIRWQAHALLLSMYSNSSPPQKESLLELLWSLLQLLPAYGRRTAQFVDLLGYFSLKTKDIETKMGAYMEQAVLVLQAQNQLLSQHSNAQLYSGLSQYVELEGYYLESEPCLVCNNPEIPFSTIKLSSIKIDSKFTTTTTIVKLVNSHTISKITLRIADLKRTKMVRVINIYYNDRTVQAVVELKNKPALWHKAKKVTLSSGQTDIKIDFPLPITACNLMIEYADFYETVQGTSESLQCPRCSAAVPAHPGVCGNCGENVFQCHKCRAINYDEKDPFLCHACGFCKYAKFDYSLFARTCCAVDTIENDDDRRKTVQNINNLLEKADRVYQQLINNKPVLELLVKKVSEHRSDFNVDDTMGGFVVNSTSQVNKVVQLIAQKYCVESKNYFEELSKILQRVEASRKELVSYDKKQMDFLVVMNTDTNKNANTKNRCYGCGLAATEHCLTLLRVMATFAPCRWYLIHKQGVLQELVNHNLRGGTHQIQEEVRQLLCLLTRDCTQDTELLCTLLVDRITLALKAQVTFCDFYPGVRHEMALLAELVAQEDSCWEMKLRTVMKLFILGCNETRSPAVMEAIVLPCLRILQSVVSPAQPTSQLNKDKTLSSLSSICPPEGITINLDKWLNSDQNESFAAWRQKMPKKLQEQAKPAAGASEISASEEKTTSVKEEVKNNAPKLDKNTIKKQTKDRYLTEKYAYRWRHKLQRMHGLRALNLDGTWLKQVLFSPRSRLARQVACTIVQSLSQTHERHREMLGLLTGYLQEIGRSGKSSDEFLVLYKSLTEEAPWKQYLALKGVLTHLADLLTKEIQDIQHLEETTLTADIAQGYALKQITELLSSFLEDTSIRQSYKGRLVGAVLGGYLSLKSLVVQRTRLIDDTQEQLLEMLEEMTTGTEAETKAFMSVCMETVTKYPLMDVRTPVFIFERLCSIIYPEENDIGEFFLSLEKDPQQEDFLQGRMLGNPYSSNEAGLGPLMRDVKNKICQDCELVALLEDDNGMELLVNNKIMSLDLPVKEVYKKVWLGEQCEGESMRVVYRMRGLLGDATEEFVETLRAKTQQSVDNEELYRMANVLADCGGLQIMLDRLNAMQNVSRSRPLLQVLLKLFRLCVKVRKCQEVLCRPDLRSVAVFLKVLQLCLQSESDSQLASVTEQLLDIMETILSKAANESLASFLQFSSTFGGPEYVQALLSCTNNSSVRNNPPVLNHLTRVVAALVYGNDIKMALLCEHFKTCVDFNKFDFDRSSEDEFRLELFCVLCTGIEKNCIGGTLKDYILSLGIVKNALEYITMHAPCVKPTLLRTDSDELKEFISKPALKYILRFLTGLATEHEAAQLLISEDIIPIIHRLEQVSSDEHVGSLAENLLEALRTDPATAARVQQVREFTRAEKKRLAMAMREKQLGAMGMRTNDKGQVTAKAAILQQMEDLGEETGLVCVICREGYKCQPTKVLGIYTFSKRCNVEDYDTRARWTMGYTTVTHFNVVHFECHMSAVRLARARDEWESAGLQNANTRCNGLLPLWGMQVPELAFASSLARHDTYLQESTGHRDIGYASTVHDLKLLFLRFAQEKSFHEDAGGGGPQSNMHLVPYLIHMALYVINTTRTAGREEKSLSSFLDTAMGERWIESAHEAEGPLYSATMALHIQPGRRWKRTRLTHLRRLLVLAHVRRAHHIGPVKSIDGQRTMYAYSVYKPYLMFYGLIDLAYKHFFKSVPEDDSWPIALALFIRRSDELLLRSSEALLSAFNEELLPCTSFDEFCDVAGLLEEIPDPSSFITEMLNELP